MSLQQGKIPYGKIPDGKIPDGKKPKVYRKAILSDFITDTPSNGLDNCTANKFEKPKNYRIQGEFGQKKFIKPWRTGTKSQQLPPMGNFKKNKGNH